MAHAPEIRVHGGPLHFRAVDPMRQGWLCYCISGPAIGGMGAGRAFAMLEYMAWYWDDWAAREVVLAQRREWKRCLVPALRASLTPTQAELVQMLFQVREATRDGMMESLRLLQPNLSRALVPLQERGLARAKRLEPGTFILTLRGQQLAMRAFDDVQDAHLR